MLRPEYPTYFLDRRPGEPAPDEIDRIGGLPRGIALESWPRSPDGVPMIHLLTVEVRERQILSGPRAVAVFVTSLVDFSAFQEGEQQACIVPLSDQDLARGMPANAEIDVLQACALSVSAFGTVRCASSDGQVELGWEWAPGIDAEPIGKKVGSAEVVETACVMFEELIEAERQGSYLGGFHVISSHPPADPNESEHLGRFLMRLSESLFLPEANFAGGGYLFVYEKDAWAEQ